MGHFIVVALNFKSLFIIIFSENQILIFLLRVKCKVGGLDLSRRDLDRDLDLDAKKKSVSTVEIFSTVWKTTSRQSRFSRQFKNQVSTALKIEISRVKISIKISISTPKKSQSRPSRKSRQVLKTGLDAKDVLDLDLDWSRRRDPQP